MARYNYKPSHFLLFFTVLLSAQCNPSSRQTRNAESENPPDFKKNPDLLDGNYGKSALEIMPIGELMLLEQERRNQSMFEEEELTLLDAINTALCRKMEEKRSFCPAIKRLIFDPTEQSLRCDGSQAAEIVKAPIIEVTIPKNKTGSYVLVANDLYTSSKFGAGGPTKIIFSHSGGGFQAPQFLKVYKLVLRSADADNKVLPQIESFSIKITIDGVELLDELMLESDDEIAKERNEEFKISVSDIVNLRKSGTCKVNQHDIDNLKNSIRNSITQDQVISKKQDYQQAKAAMDFSNVSSQSTRRSDLINKIFQYRSEIELRFPVLEGERNRQFKLTNELKTDMRLGCHARLPITSFAVELEGSMNNRTELGQQDFQKADQYGDGASTELLFDFGGVKFSIDFAKQNIFQTKYIYEKDVSDEALVASLDRIYIRKKSSSFDNVPVPCNTQGGFVGSIGKLLFNETCYDVYEEGVFHISALSVFVNEKKIFAKRDLKIRFTHELKVYEDDLQSNAAWVKLMLEEDCDANN